jgi:hypothetical protein
MEQMVEHCADGGDTTKKFSSVFDGTMQTT